MKIKELIFKISGLSFDQTLEYLVKKAKDKGGKTFVVTINPEIIMLARHDSEYEKILNSADLALNDGVGVTLAGKMLGKSFKGRVHGSDLVEKLSEAASKQPITVGFLGGKENVAQLSADCLRSKYPGLNVAFAVEEVDRLQTTDYSKTLIAVDGSPKAVSLKCDILFVAFGSPKQEKWIAENLPSINVRVTIGVGGAFDFISGRVRRAPKFARSLGLEWLFRLVIQPWRIKRQLNLAGFVFLVIIEKIIG